MDLAWLDCAMAHAPAPSCASYDPDGLTARAPYNDRPLLRRAGGGRFPDEGPGSLSRRSLSDEVSGLSRRKFDDPDPRPTLRRAGGGRFPHERSRARIDGAPAVLFATQSEANVR
ncbi:hypothetical protein M885DRAFT_511645 [Pelagophyceae sp. CCMP2097]|nr:hypothetical protein M885DRAFT_511645 [Pelagophyceae sp. CCMP2097]